MRRTAALVLCLALTACTHGGGDAKPSPTPSASPTPTIPGVVQVLGLKHTHVRGHVTYDQTPPMGGPHNPVWLGCAVYDEAVPNEHAVHSMEHGAVWITYRPDLSQKDVDIVHRLQGLKPAFVLVSPYPGLPALVVASAWGLQLQVQKVDDPRLADFVRQYAGGPQGGEGPRVRCDNGATLDQVKSLDARESAAASASGSPTS
jgi:hypothetical protein